MTESTCRPLAERCAEVIGTTLDGAGKSIANLEVVTDYAREILRGLGTDRDVWDADHFTVRTLRYYRSQGLLSDPEGRTSNARYDHRHVLEAVAARLAGQVGRLTLSEAARQVAAVEGEDDLRAFVADLVGQALEEDAGSVQGPDAPRSLPGVSEASTSYASRPVRSERVHRITLAGDLQILVPEGHPALDRAGSPEALAQTLSGLDLLGT